MNTEQVKQLVSFLCERVEFCQSKGCYTIKDAYVLKECIDFLSNGSSSNKEINEKNAIDGVMQALNIGQSKGVFSLEEAHKIYEYTEQFLKIQEQKTEEKSKEEPKITEI